MKILLIGSKGMLGSVFAEQEIRLPGDVLYYDIDDIDITDSAQTKTVFSDFKPNVLINCSAYTNVDGAETDKKKCYAVNVDGVKNLAIECKKHNTFFVHYSTDFVFDGEKETPYTVDDSPAPTGYYGLTKYEGEKHIQAILEETQYLIIRTSWLYGPRGKNFISTIINASNDRPKLQVVADQQGSPTYTRDLAKATLELINNSAHGIFHVTNSYSCTWHDLAEFSISLIGKKNYEIEKITSDQFKCPAKRPAYSVMSTDKLNKVCGHKMRSWQEAVKDYIQEFHNTKN